MPSTVCIEETRERPEVQSCNMTSGSSACETQLSGASFPSGQHSVAELSDHAHDLEPDVFSTNLLRDTEWRAECQSSSPTPDSPAHEVHCVRGQSGTSSAKEGIGEVGVQHLAVFSADLGSVGTQPDAPAVQPQASQEEDPGLGTSAQGAAVGAARPTQSRRRGSSASSMRPQDHPFLQLQQTGFDMLERELAGMRRATNTRLDRVAMLLRPLGRIASSLDRIATATERAWPPNDPPPPPVVPLPPPVVPLPPPVVPLPPPVVPLPPPIPSPSTRSTRSTSSIATPGPSYVESRRGRRKRPYRGGRK
ncbi:unnamed protein product [Arctogadus glacialis]